MTKHEKTAFFIGKIPKSDEGNLLCNNY